MSLYNFYLHIAQRLAAIITWPFSSEAPRESKKTPAAIKEIYEDFIHALNYSPQEAIPEENEIYQSLLSEFSSYAAETGEWFKSNCRLSATMAQLCYSHNSREARLQIARFTWHIAYIDDLGQKCPSSLHLQSFQQRILANDYIESRFLKGFRDHLASFYDLWDTIAANSITTDGLAYVNGWMLEQTLTIRDMEIWSGAQSWPYYLRTKTGAAEAFAFMLFPNEHKIDMTEYIQVIDDIGLFMNLANDILSFYKEDLAGETKNYVCNRARVSQKSIPDTLQDIVKDTLDAHKRVTDVLKGTNIPWPKFVNGVLAFHHTLTRYRLGDLGLPVSY